MVDDREYELDSAAAAAGATTLLGVGDKHVVELDQRLPAVEIETDQKAGDRIGQVVMPARGIVDQSFPLRAVRRSSPQSWADKRGMVEKFDATGVQKRQQVVIEIRLRPGALLEFDAMLGESSDWPLAGVFVAGDLVTP